MFELNYEAEVRFSLFAIEKTRQINFNEILFTLTLQRNSCDSFPVHSRN